MFIFIIDLLKSISLFEQLPTAVYNEEIQPLYSVEMQKLAKQFQVHHLEYKQYRSLNEAIIAVQTGKALAAMWFDRNFSKAIQTRALGPQTHTKINDDYSNENWPTESTTTTIEPFSDQTTTIEINQTFTTETTETYSTFTETESTFLPTTTEFNRSKRDKDDSENEEFDDDDDGGGEDDEDEYDTNKDYQIGNFVHLSNQTLRSSSIKIFLDNSNMFYAQPWIDMVNFASWELMNKVVEDNDQVTLTSPVVVQEVVYSENAQIPDFLLSGYMIAFLYLSQVTLASQLLIQERNDGFFDRAIVAGAKHWLMFTSHFITNFLLSFFQIALMFIIGFHWYSIPILGSYWLAYSIVVLQSASSIMTGKCYYFLMIINFIIILIITFRFAYISNLQRKLFSILHCIINYIKSIIYKRCRISHRFI